MSIDKQKKAQIRLLNEMIRKNNQIGGEWVNDWIREIKKIIIKSK